MMIRASCSRLQSNIYCILTCQHRSNRVYHAALLYLVFQHDGAIFNIFQCPFLIKYILSLKKERGHISLLEITFHQSHAKMACNDEISPLSVISLGCVHLNIDTIIDIFTKDTLAIMISHASFFRGMNIAFGISLFTIFTPCSAK